LRLARLTNATELASAARRSLAVAAGVAAAALLGGCEVKSFLDPSEMGRYDRAPLVMPILRTLDTGVEEINEDFLNAAPPRPEDLVPQAIDYRIDRGDLISVAVTDLQAPGVETVKTVRVSESGNVSLPYIGPVQALGRTEAELEQDVVRAYGPEGANLIQRAQVSVTVAEARGRTFSILGSVAAPGQYAIVQSDFRILDALVVARDTSTVLVKELYVLRKVSADQQQNAAPARVPTTGPANDVLAPRTGAGPSKWDDLFAPKPSAATPVLLQAEPDDGVAPATAPAEPGGRYVTVDGREVLVREPNAGPGAAVTETTPPDRLAPEPTAPSDARATPFEFQPPPTSADMRVIRVNLLSLRSGDLSQNIVVRAGDMIIVPTPGSVGVYYVGGHVQRTGVYQLAQDQTLKQAIISAGMLDQLAIPERTDVIRRVAGDREVYARVDLTKIFDGSQPDLYLKPNDQIMVGTNFLAPFLAAIRGGFRVTYGFGFLYDRNFASEENNDFRQ